MAKIVTHQDTRSFLGSEDLLQEAQAKSFPQLIFEMLSEKTPTEKELAVFELILNISIDHGPETPSATALLAKTSEGVTISEAVAEGILQINDTHGGAMEPAMRFFYKIRDEKLSNEQLAELISDYLDNKKIIGGFGHRIYKDVDPRAELILNYLKNADMGKEFIDIALRVEKEIEKQKERKLPLNIDGAIAIILCSFGWEARTGKAVFIIARTPGLCAHYLNNSK